jgi:hypothetical protein
VRSRIALALVSAWSLLYTEQPALAAEDATTPALREGEIIDYAQHDRLRPHLPPELNGCPATYPSRLPSGPMRALPRCRSVACW